MKLKYFLFLTITILAHGCSQEDSLLITNSPNQLSFQVEKLNSDDNFNTSVKSFESKVKSAGWKLNPDGKIQLTREIVFEVKLENGQSVEFGFWFIKYETDENTLILMDENLNYRERNWDYVSTEVEESNFFQEFDEARVMINANVIFHHETNENFKIESIEPTAIDGKEKSYITINFHGVAYGYYDPTGEYAEVYKLTNGIFKGVIE